MRLRELFLLFVLSQVLLGYINGIQLAKFGLLIERTSPIYMKVRLKALSSVICLIFDKFLLKLGIIGVWKYIGKEKE